MLVDTYKLGSNWFPIEPRDDSYAIITGFLSLLFYFIFYYYFNAFIFLFFYVQYINTCIVLFLLYIQCLPKI
jgi:hypothetical protein